MVRSGKSWIDLSQPLHNNIPFSKALGSPQIEHLCFVLGKPGEETIASVTRYCLTVHHGTHLDAPRHLIPDGKTIDEYPFTRFTGTGVILDMRKKDAVPLTINDFERAQLAIQEGDIVLLYTGWADKYLEESYHLHPYLSEEAAGWLVKRKISIVGLDVTTVDLPVPLRGESFDFPVHKILLQNDVLIIEHLGPGLKDLLNRRVTVACFPVKILGADGAPSPVFALIEK
jgi:kynurenine formamidase